MKANVALPVTYGRKRPFSQNAESVPVHRVEMGGDARRSPIKGACRLTLLQIEER